MKKLAILVVALVAQPALAKDNPAAGARIEARLGYETPTVSGGGAVYKIGSAVSYGGEIGYDLGVSENVAIGPFATYEFSSVDLCNGGTCLGADGNLAVGGRFSYALGPKSVVYAKIAYDRFRLKASTGGAAGTQNLDGVQGAIGYDYNVSKNIYVGLEFDYADLGSFSGVNFQRRHVAATVGARF